MRLLLINPRAPESFWTFRWAIDHILPGKRAINPPLGLATLAALCPESWHVEIVDENVEPIPRDPMADIIGVCGMGVQFPRQRELLTHFRQLGYYTVAGGSYASLCPENYADIADTVVAGEAEYIWPEFCADFEAGAAKRLYRETREVALSDSPAPRVDLLKLDRYAMVSMQFSRGCPFQCEFCDIIVMFGRKPRTKAPAQVLGELDILRAHGVRNVFFVDDNFIGNKREARELLRAIAAYQREHRYAFRFGTEASINLAQDEELMQLMREANFQWVFIGIESPDCESLRETGKLQNTREDMLLSLRKIYQHAIDVFAGFIVGFDHDTPSTFDRQRNFILRSGVQVAMVGLLTALPRTPLHTRLAAEGRLMSEDSSDNTRLGTNVIPKRMTIESMRSGYQELYRSLFTDRRIADRIRAKLRYLEPSATGAGYSIRQQMAMLARLLFRGIRPGGLARWWHFVRTALAATPRQIPMVASDWIAGLSMRQYAERFVIGAREIETRAVERCTARLRKSLRRWIDDGALELHLDAMRQALPNLSVTVRDFIDSSALPRAARQLRRMLRRTKATLSLRIEECDAAAAERLLNRLARYGDRVTLSVSAAIRDVVDVDWSRFHMAGDQ